MSSEAKTTITLLKGTAAVCLLLAGLSGCSQPVSEPQPSSSPEVSIDEETAKSMAKRGFEKLGGSLKEQLQSAMGSGGPVAAVEVCHTVAPELAQSVSEELGFKVGRSSHRLRSQKNLASPVIEEYLSKYSETPAADAPVEAIEKDGVWTVIAPIPTQPLCLTCHGEAEALDPELLSALKEKYPEDQAVGFKEGDIRGVFWAEIPHKT